MLPLSILKSNTKVRHRWFPTLYLNKKFVYFKEALEKMHMGA
jgi:hypothetical protein